MFIYRITPNVPDYAEVSCLTIVNPQNMSFHDSCEAYATSSNANLYQNHYSSKSVFNEKLLNKRKSDSTSFQESCREKNDSKLSSNSKSTNSSSVSLSNPEKNLSKVNITENKIDLINDLNKTPSSSNYASTSQLLNTLVELKANKPNSISKRNGNMKFFKSEYNINFGCKIVNRLSNSSTKLNSPSVKSLSKENDNCLSPKPNRLRKDVVNDEDIADMFASETCYISPNDRNITKFDSHLDKNNDENYDFDKESNEEINYSKKNKYPNKININDESKNSSSSQIYFSSFGKNDKM